eukprot:312114_1
MDEKYQANSNDKFIASLYVIEAKELKLVQKIFENILVNPNIPKYQNLHAKAIRRKVTNYSIILNMLIKAGFYESNDGSRLLYNIEKINDLKSCKSMIKSIGFGQLTQFACNVGTHYFQHEFLSCHAFAAAINFMNSNKFIQETVNKVELVINITNAHVKAQKENKKFNISTFASTVEELKTKYKINHDAAVQIFEMARNGNKKTKNTHSKRSQSHSNCCEINNCLCLEIMQTLLTRYCQHTENNVVDDIYIHIGNNYNSVDLLNDFNHLLSQHTNQFEVIYNRLNRIYNGNGCDSCKCASIKRHYRDRSTIRNNENKLKELYFDMDNIVKQQLLDRIHCYYFHSYKLKNKQNERQYQFSNCNGLSALKSDETMQDDICDDDN